MSHLQKRYLASANANNDINDFIRVDSNPFKLSAVGAAAGAFSLPLLHRVGGSSPTDPGDWAPFSPEGTALALTNAASPMLLALPGFYKLDLTGFTGEVFAIEHSMRTTIALPSSSAAAILGSGSLSPLQPLPLAPVATFTLLPASGNTGDIIFVTDASGDPNVTVGGAQYTWNGAAWVISGRESPTSADGQVATIAARDALTPVIGQTTNVVDASADPAITAGEATYIWDGNSWITIDPLPTGLVYVTDATIAVRDARTPANGDFSYVADASADPAIAAGAAFYQFVNGAWVLQLNNRYNDYAVYANIAARDADAAVLDGDVAFVTDASADPAITAGSAYYVRVNGLWVLQLNASGLSYVAYATVAARDAATVIDGDFAEVTDASADPNVAAGTAFYQRRSGAWVRIEGRSFEYVTDTTIAVRDARVNVENGDVSFVTDASADPLITAGSATYIRSNGVWVLQENTRFNDYAVYTTITTRDAATGVLDGDWAQVTDASLDPAITAGSAIYQRIGGAWVLRFNGNGLVYATYTTITTRDAATVNDGDIAFVTDASLDPNIIAGAATYDRVNGAWVQRFDTRFNDYALYATIVARDADVNVLDGDVAFVTDASADANVDSGSATYDRVNGAWVQRSNEHAYNVVRSTATTTAGGAAVLSLATLPVANNEQVLITIPATATALSFTAASLLTGTSPGDERHLKFTNTAAVSVAINTANFPAYLNGSAFPNPVTLAAGATLDVFMKHTDQLRPYASSADVVTSAGGMTYTAVADIAARDALAANAGDIAIVADPTADIFFDVAVPQKFRWSGTAWAAIYEDTNEGGIGVQTITNSTVGVNVFDLASLSLIGSEGGIDLILTATTALTFINALPIFSTAPGFNPVRRIALFNSSPASMSVDLTNFPFRMDGQSYGTGIVVPANTAVEFLLTPSIVNLNAWVVVQSTLLAATSGLAYTSVANIAARDALAPADGGFAFVADASADVNVGGGSATYQRINGVWVQEHDGKALSVERALSTNVATLGTISLSLATFDFAQYESATYVFTGLGAGPLNFAQVPTNATEGDVRVLNLANATGGTLTVNGSTLSALGATYIDGSALPTSFALANGNSVVIFFRGVNVGGTAVALVEHTTFDLASSQRMSFNTVANITARDALSASANDGDVVQVTDASTEADVSLTGVIDARYRRISGAWERIHERIPSLSGEGDGLAIPITTAGAASFNLATVDFVKNVWTNLQLNNASTLAFTGVIPNAVGGSSDAGAFRFMRIDNIGVADFFIDYTNFPSRLDGEPFKTSERMLSGTSKDFIFWRIAPGQPWRTISGGNKPTPKLYAGLYLPLTPNVAPFSDLPLTGGALDTGTLARTATSVRLLANRVYKIDYLPRMDDAAGGYVDIALRNITTATDMIDARFPTVNYGTSGLISSGLSMIFDTAVTGDVQVGVRINSTLGMGNGLIDVLGGSFIVTEL